MALTSVRLKPGVNTMMTPLMNEAGVSQSQLVRYQQGMIQKYGGWQSYQNITVGSTIRELWGWQGLTGIQHLAIGATQSLSVVTSNNNQVVTPQTAISNRPPSISTVNGSNVVTITDVNSGTNTLTSIYFNTPVYAGGLLLNGAYNVTSVLSTGQYQITSSRAATITASSSGVLPLFSVSSGSASVLVDLPANNFTNTLGLAQQFIAPSTNVGSMTIQGPYQVQTTYPSSPQYFTINMPQPALTASSSVPMNQGNMQIVYYYTVVPPVALGFGQNYFGGNTSSTAVSSAATGAYGTSGLTAPVSGATITATDWSLTNWGETLLAVPSNGPLYQWSANSGYQNASIVATAPFYNGGCFVSQPMQILVLWRSVQSTGVQDPLIVRWSDSLDYTNYNVTSQTWAGSFHIATGSIIRGGIQSAQQGIIWTDIDCYVMQNVGQPIVFGFNRVGSGCGMVGQHACGVLDGGVYWMGPDNFFMLGTNGVQPLPCSVWNFVFDQIDQANIWKVRCATNALFHEIAWFFPRIGGTGENSLYVKLNLLEGEWDYGSLGRSAWIDVTVLGNPIGSDLSGNIWQHDVGYNAGTVSLDNNFVSGWWAIADGDQISVVDWILPDMKFATYGGGSSATITISFLSCYYVGGPITTNGPYTFSTATQYINTRIRGRFLAVQIRNNTLNDFWRIGKIHYRFAADGRQ
jgi:hypothetical protein